MYGVQKKLLCKLNAKLHKKVKKVNSTAVLLVLQNYVAIQSGRYFQPRPKRGKPFSPGHFAPKASTIDGYI